MKTTKSVTLRKQSIQINDIAYISGFNGLAVWVKEYDADNDRYLCRLPYNSLEWIATKELIKHKEV